MTTKTFYRLVTPKSFANQEFDTLEEAIAAKKQWGKASDPNYAQFWKEQGDLCKIVQVIEITNEITA